NVRLVELCKLHTIVVLNCPKCRNPVDGHYCQGCALLWKKFKEDLFTYCIENGILQDSSEPSNDNTNVVNALKEPFVVKQDPGENSLQSPPQINHHCCYGCEPFNNQTIDELPQTVPSFDPSCYFEDGNSFTYDSKSNLVHDSPNVFDPPSQPPLYSCEFCGNDARYGHYCTPQVSFIYPEPYYNQDFNFPQDFHDFQQQYLCCENYGVPHEAYQCQLMNEDYYHEQNSCYDPNSFGFDQFQPPQYTVNNPIFNAQNDLFNSQSKLMEQLTSMCDMVGQYIQKKEEDKKIEEEQAAKARYWKISVCYDDDDEDYTIAEEDKKIEEEQAAKARYWKISVCYDDDDEDYTIAVTHKKPDNSLSMGDELLDTILATESDEFIKSSVKNLVPNPSKSEGEYDMGDEHLDTILATESDEFIKSSVKNLVPNPSKSEGEYECDVPACEVFTTFSNILFDADYDFSSSDDQLFSDEDVPKEIYSNPLFDEEIISMKIDPHHFDAESDLIESLLNRDSPIISSSSKIDSFFYDDSLMKEIDLSFTPDDPMPPGIEKDNYDSERDILIFEGLLSNDSLSLPENESFHFDIPSSSRPPAKPPDGNTGILNVKVMGDISEHKPGHLAARLGCAETKVATWDDLAFKLIALGRNVKHENFCENR
nr:hypothetical protein [Tanacetum cinerariifolium]